MPRRSAVVLVVALAGCPAGAPPDETTAAPSTLEPASATVRTRALRVTAGLVTVEPTDDGATVTVPLRLVLDRPPRFDGTSMVTDRAVVVDTRAVVLASGDVAVSPRPPAATVELPETVVLVPVEPPRRTDVELVFDWKGELPEDLALRLEDDSGTAELWLSGGPRTSAGEPAVAVQLVDLAGRPLPLAGVLRWSDGEEARGAVLLPWRAPADEGRATLELEGGTTIPVVWEPGARQVEVVHPPGDAASALEAAFAATWPDFPGAPPADLEALAARLRTPAEVGAWIREHIAVLATDGVRQSPGQTVELGGGSPVERAVLARDLLARNGIDTWLICGDLPAADARAFYRTRLDLPELPAPLAEQVEAARARVDALSAALEDSLGAFADRPAGRRPSFGLIPEWCWVEPLAAPGDPPPEPVDLRPAPFHEREVPYRWRGTQRIVSEQWSVEFRVLAVHTTSSGVEETVVAANRVHLAQGSGGAWAIDLWRSGDGVLRSSITAAGEELAVGRDTPDLPEAGLDTVLVEVFTRDPRALGTRTWKVELWTRGDPLPDAQRMLLTVGGVAPDAGDLARRLERAVEQRHPVPGLVALAARHDLYTVLRTHLADGELPADPPILATVASLRDGEVGWRMEVMPTTPVRVGEDVPLSAIARFAAADAVARALVLGAEDPTLPTVWATAREQLGKRTVPQSVQIYMVRYLDQYAVGAPSTGQDGDLWVVDRRTGGVGWYMGVPVVTTPDLGHAVPVGTASPLWPELRWERLVRCGEAARWGATPTGCLPTEAQRP